MMRKQARATPARAAKGKKATDPKTPAAAAKKDSAAVEAAKKEAAAARMRASEEAAAAVRAPAPPPEPAPTTGAEEAGATLREKAVAAAKAARPTKSTPTNKPRSLAAMLEELDSTLPEDEVVELRIVPGPPQVYVLKGDEIPTPGDPLGTSVLIGGKNRQVICPAGTGTDTGLTPFTIWGDEDDDGEEPLVMITNPALERRLRDEGMAVIGARFIEAGGRLLGGEIDGCAAEWKQLMNAAVDHSMMTLEQEEEIIQSMMNPHSGPGTLRLFLSVLEVFVGHFGALRNKKDIVAMIETMDMAVRAAKKRKLVAEGDRPKASAAAAAAAAAEGSLAALTEETMFSAGDSTALGLAIDIEGRFNAKIDTKAGQTTLHKACAAKRSAGLVMVIESVTERTSEDQPELSQDMVAAIVKASLNKDNVKSKLADVTCEPGLHGFFAASAAVERVAVDAGLGGDVLGVTSIASSLKKELKGVTEAKLRAASEDIAGLAWQQLGQHFSKVARGRMHGVRCTERADTLTEPVKRKVRELKVALNFFAGALRFAAPRAAPPLTPTAPAGPAAPKMPAAPLKPAPQPLAVGRGGGGTKSPLVAIDEMRAISYEAQATTACPFMDTARGCTKQACLFKH